MKLEFDVKRAELRKPILDLETKYEEHLGKLLEKVAVDEWLPRVEALKKENPELWAEKTRHTFEFVDVAGNDVFLALIQDLEGGPIAGQDLLVGVDSRARLRFQCSLSVTVAADPPVCQPDPIQSLGGIT